MRGRIRNGFEAERAENNFFLLHPRDYYELPLCVALTVIRLIIYESLEERVPNGACFSHNFLFNRRVVLTCFMKSVASMFLHLKSLVVLVFSCLNWRPCPTVGQARIASRIVLYNSNLFSSDNRDLLLSSQYILPNSFFISS